MVRAQLPSRGDIVHLDLSPSAGKEQAGRHYAVVVSNRQYNAATGIPFLAPISTVAQASKGNSMAVSLTGAGTSVTGAIQVDQIKPLDWKGRGGKLVNQRVPDYVMDEILEILGGIFGPEDAAGRR